MVSKLLQKAFPDPGMKILAGVSGGVDSLVLLDGLHRNGYQVTAAHFNHQIRPEAAREALFVQDFCQSLQVPFLCGSEDVVQYARENSLSLEEAARDLRYTFLFSRAKALNMDLVCTAHHADDQVETILMNLLRGAGMEGLSGMQADFCPNPWSEEIPLVRPLLDLEKQDLLQYADHHSLKYMEDPSNQDQTFLRNRIRHDLIPDLEDIQNGFKTHILQMGKILHQESDFLEEVTRAEFSRIVRRLGPEGLEINRSLFLQHHLAVQRRLVRMVFHTLRDEGQELPFQQVQSAVDFIKCQTSAAEENWVARLNLISRGNQVLVSGWESGAPRLNYPQLPAGNILQVPIPGQVSLGDRWVFRVEKIKLTERSPDQLREQSDPYQILVSGDELGEKSLLRPRRPGDQMAPLGMVGSLKKISELMIDEKIPRQVREHWPLWVIQDEIVWLPGVCMADSIRVKQDTRRVFRVNLNQG